ncbi:hypothetical protein ACFZBU_36375 [Embleya sp. NPDC008237]|uniref:hypothetical protein n=1 Tax=Embleya sp. NPDC008237 TaxID=3363978 RepID=UPI0036E2EEA4
MPELFELFRRFRPDRPGSSKGSGLDLSIVRAIVHATRPDHHHRQPPWRPHRRHGPPSSLHAKKPTEPTPTRTRKRNRHERLGR